MADVKPEIIERAAQGDVEAFAEVYQAYSAMTYGIALRIVGRAEDAEEVVQDVFVAVFRGLAKFSGQSTLKTWIYRITVNASLNAVRRLKRRRVEMAIPEGMDVEDKRNDVEESIERETHEKLAQHLLEKMNPEYRACLILRAQEGLSYQQIANALNININTVRSRLKRAREAAIKAHREGGLAS